MNTQELQRQHDVAAMYAIELRNRLNASAAAEGRALGPGEITAINQSIREANAIKARLDRAEGDAGMNLEIQKLTSGMTPVGGTRGAGRGGDLGQQFINSATYEDIKRGVHRASAFRTAPAELYAATLTEDSASGGDLVVTDHRPGILPLAQRQIVLTDLIASGTTDSNSVNYMKETTFTNAADTVAEGADKPESTLIFDAVADPVRKIAHWLPVTEEMLEDVPGLRSYINSRLQLGVRLVEEDQILNGLLNTAPDITGILNRAGLSASIARVAEVNADTLLSQIMAIWQATNLQPDGIVLNPAQWKTILQTKDTTGQYYGGGPFASPHAPTLWGLPVALTPAIAAGVALVGAFRSAAQIFRKGGMRVEVSNSHSDFFIKNLLAIRAETRLALAVYRPAAFGTCTNLN